MNEPGLNIAGRPYSLRRWLVLLISGPLFAAGVFAGLLIFIDQVTARRAEAIVAGLGGPTRQDTVINVAKWVSTEFDQSDEKAPWYRKYGFLLSHRIMPDFLRLKRGSLAMLYMDGACNNMSWVLERLYTELGIDAIQHNWVGPSSAHSALSVRLNGGWVWIDPFYGVAFAESGKLISLSRLKELVSAGAAPEDYMIALSEKPMPRVYDGIGRVSHGRDGDPVDINIMVPLDGGPITVGSLDGQWTDVLRQGLGRGLTGHLHYVGPQYSRYFFLRFVADPDAAPRGFRIIYHLLDAIDPNNLPESNVAPRIEGNRLIYQTTDPSQGIRLSFENMRWTLTNLLRRRSWYNVDMVEFVPL